MWPPMRSPMRSERSRLTRVPGASLPRVVRRSVSGETSTVKRWPRRAVTVRQAPFTAMLSPSPRRGRGRGVAMVRRAPLPLVPRRSTRPVVWMLPVNNYPAGRRQPRPRDEREREDQADADERQAEHDAARADGVPEHRGAGSVARGALWRHRRPGMVGRRMIPLRDNIPSARVPIVNYAIITANVL